MKSACDVSKRDLGKWNHQRHSHNVTISRIYRDGEEWKSSDSFGRYDFTTRHEIADLAHTWIYEQAQESAKAEKSSS